MPLPCHHWGFTNHDPHLALPLATGSERLNDRPDRRRQGVHFIFVLLPPAHRRLWFILLCRRRLSFMRIRLTTPLERKSVAAFLSIALLA